MLDQLHIDLYPSGGAGDQRSWVMNAIIAVTESASRDGHADMYLHGCQEMLL
jgi:hypothetical protein